jgi:hypothetical protein
VLRGWLADHEWRLTVAALMIAAAAACGVGHGRASPLGHGYAGIDLAGAAVLLGSAAFALSLRSTLSRRLAIPGPWPARAAWLGVTTGALGATVALSLGSAGVGRVVDVCATVGFVAGGLGIMISEGVALAYVFVCGATILVTPTSGGHLPWWSLVLNEDGGMPRYVASCMVIAVVSAVYLVSPAVTHAQCRSHRSHPSS